MRPGWLAAWAAAFDRGVLRAVVARRDGNVVGVLPVVSRGRSLQSPTDTETALYAPLAAPGVTFDQLLDLVPAAGFARMQLGFLLDSDRTVNRIREDAHRRRLPILCRPVRRSPFVDVSGEWEDYQPPGLPRSRRRKLRRGWRRLADAGRPVVELHTGGDDLDRRLEEGFALEARGWKGAQGTAVLSRPDTRAFYWDAARWAAEAGVLRLWSLRLDDRPIAFIYALAQHDTLYLHKTAYDPDYATYGPGLLLVWHILEHAFSQPGLSRLELVGEAEDYKLELATGTHDQVRLDVFFAPWRGAAHVAALQAATGARDLARRRIPPATRVRLQELAARPRGAARRGRNRPHPS